jgi:hypothetical protein
MGGPLRPSRGERLSPRVHLSQSPSPLRVAGPLPGSFGEFVTVQSSVQLTRIASMYRSTLSASNAERDTSVVSFVPAIASVQPLTDL